MRFHLKQGQTVLITVLTLTIALTVALSLMRRTITDVAVTGDLEDSARAFSAAEAGIEDVLKRASGISTTIQSGDASASYSTTFTNLGSSDAQFFYPTTTEKGDVATFWLVGHTSDNALDLSGATNYCNPLDYCMIDFTWSYIKGSPLPAYEIEILYQNRTTNAFEITRYAYDPSSSSRPGNKFTSTSSGGGTPTFAANGDEITVQRTLSLAQTNEYPIAVRFRPYYENSRFSVIPTNGRTLPAQGYEVSSTGKTDSGVTRKIIVKKNYESPASLFDYVLYSNTTISSDHYAP